VDHGPGEHAAGRGRDEFTTYNRMALTVPAPGVLATTPPRTTIR
jgi:hypothetical protein